MSCDKFDEKRSQIMTAEEFKRAIDSIPTTTDPKQPTREEILAMMKTPFKR